MRLTFDYTSLLLTEHRQGFLPFVCPVADAFSTPARIGVCPTCQIARHVEDIVKPEKSALGMSSYAEKNALPLD